MILTMNNLKLDPDIEMALTFQSSLEYSHIQRDGKQDMFARLTLTHGLSTLVLLKFQLKWFKIHSSNRLRHRSTDG